MGHLNTPTGLTFKPDGTKLYVVGQNNDRVYEYNLSTPWSVSTASYLQSVFVAVVGGSPAGVQFKPDGTQMYVAETLSRSVHAISLGTAWNVSTADLENISTANTGEFLSGLYFKADGTRFYTVYQSVLRQFSLPTR